MTKTCYVQTQVLADTKSAEPSVSMSSSNKHLFKRFSFPIIAWPFLPQGTTCSSPSTNKDQTTCPTTVRQRRLVSASTFAAAGVAAASLATSLTPQVDSLHKKTLAAISLLVQTLPSWPALSLYILHSLRSSLTRSLLDIAVRTALVILIIEGAVVLGSLLAASKVPPGLLFMIAAVLLLGYVAAKAISHDSVAIRRRKSSMNLVDKQR